MVAKAKPLFKGHYQPHIPADLGFYDLRLPQVRERQAEMAKEYGICAFCYYHYWFNGRRVLESPFNDVLASSTPGLPFCLCWANENWTRVWDGGENHVLLRQQYNFEDDLAHIQSLIPAFADERYIRIEGKPLFLVYRTECLPDPLRTAQIWREAVAHAGLGGLYLVRVESFRGDIDPQDIGFDAVVEFAPDWGNKGKLMRRSALHAFLAKFGALSKAYTENEVFEYQSMIELMLNKPKPPFKRFRCVTPSWDNSPRRAKGAHIFVGSTPDKYGMWLREVMHRTCVDYEGDERIIFINAWNEWGEGNHLEPDLRWGRAYLEETFKASNAL